MIRLRGHHLRLLYSYYNLYKYYNLNTFNFMERPISKNYNEIHAESIRNILLRIVTLKEGIIFIDGLDDICSTCRKYSSKIHCITRQYIEEDNRFISNYNLQKNKKYSSKDILKKLENKDRFGKIDLIK